MALFVLSLCPFDISVGVGAFVIGLSQISSFFSFTLKVKRVSQICILSRIVTLTHCCPEISLPKKFTFGIFEIWNQKIMFLSIPTTFQTWYATLFGISPMNTVCWDNPPIFALTWVHPWANLAEKPKACEGQWILYPYPTSIDRVLWVMLTMWSHTHTCIWLIGSIAIRHWNRNP